MAIFTNYNNCFWLVKCVTRRTKEFFDSLAHFCFKCDRSHSNFLTRATYLMNWSRGQYSVQFDSLRTLGSVLWPNRYSIRTVTSFLTIRHTKKKTNREEWDQRRFNIHRYPRMQLHVLLYLGKNAWQSNAIGLLQLCVNLNRCSVDDCIFFRVVLG